MDSLYAAMANHVYLYDTNLTIVLLPFPYFILLSYTYYNITISIQPTKESYRKVQAMYQTAKYFYNLKNQPEDIRMPSHSTLKKIR